MQTELQDIITKQFKGKKQATTEDLQTIYKKVMEKYPDQMWNYVFSPQEGQINTPFYIEIKVFDKTLLYFAC